MDQLYPKKGGQKVDKTRPGKIGSEKKLLTIEAHPPFTRYSNILENFLTIESQDTNRYTRLIFSLISSTFP